MIFSKNSLCLVLASLICGACLKKSTSPPKAMNHKGLWHKVLMVRKITSGLCLTRARHIRLAYG